MDDNAAPSTRPAFISRRQMCTPASAGCSWLWMQATSELKDTYSSPAYYSHQNLPEVAVDGPGTGFREVVGPSKCSREPDLLLAPSTGSMHGGGMQPLQGHPAPSLMIGS